MTPENWSCAVFSPIMHHLGNKHLFLSHASFLLVSLQLFPMVAPEVTPFILRPHAFHLLTHHSCNKALLLS